MDACDAYLPCTRNSLILKESSLFPEIFSLLICVGNFAKSRCSAAISLSGLASQTLKIAKFPVSKELARRRVRSALRRQPGSHCVGETSPVPSGKAHSWRAFAMRWTVSRFPSSPDRRPICRKSPVTTANIPVFRRLALETGFDRYCLARVAVEFGLFSPLA
jgi:hypothetical protein